MSETRLVLDLDWEQHIHEFDLRLRKQIWIGNGNSFGDAVRHIEYFSFGDPKLDQCFLHIDPDEQGRIICTIDTDDADPDTRPDRLESTQTKLLRRAVQEAAARTGRNRRACWQALIGPTPQPGTKHPALAAACQLGDLRLLPAKWLLRETIRDRPHQLTGSTGEMTSWPLILQGHAASFGEYRGAPIEMWPMDGIGAVRTAAQAAAMLTLAWRHPWIVRIEPVRIRVGTRMPAPDGIFTTAARPESVTRLPTWVEPAWSRLATDADLARAVAAWAQATQLEAHHPSTAAVLYTALIEGIGARDHDLTRCPTCHAQQGATERFRAALRRVLPNDQVKALTKTVYRLRSLTAHTGQLHGAEPELGWIPDDFFLSTNAAHFEGQTLTDLANAARSILIHALTDQDSPTSSTA